MPETKLPSELFLSQQVRDIDSSAINRHGIKGFSLMNKAAKFSFNILLERFPNCQKVTVLCGSGNNAGDGYIVAALAKAYGIACNVYFLSPPDKLVGDAQSAYQMCLAENVSCDHYSDKSLASETDNHIIVDALLGTGLNSPVRGLYADAIEAANKSTAPILAIDIPSGLNANTGSIMGTGIEADCTASFIALKLGLFTAEGQHYTGELYYDDLEVPAKIINEQTPIAHCLSLQKLLDQVSVRPRHFHKGNCGHTLIVGGDRGYGGAVLMAAEAALRCGSGLTSVITHQDHCSALLSRTPEVMVTSTENTQQVEQLLDAATVIVIGPGLGRSAWSEKLLQRVIKLDKPLVLDADALNILTNKQNWINSVDKENQGKRIYTPHPGEAARLLGHGSAGLIQQDRLHAITELSNKLGGHILLKGSGSLLASKGETISICPYGNPGMASGGMGDVLSGIIGSLVAQGFDEGFALRLATTLHARAADIAAKQSGERGLSACDLIPVVRSLLNKLNYEL